METVTEWKFDDAPKTRIWVTVEGRASMEDAHEKLVALMENRCGKGIPTDCKLPFLKPEGVGIYAFARDNPTDRIVGFFLDDKTRKDFVVCGAWKGKHGGGNDRPKKAEAFCQKAASLKREGVKCEEINARKD
jgi:hypothetical protein